MTLFRLTPSPVLRRCSACHQDKAIGAFSPNHHACRECRAARARTPEWLECRRLYRLREPVPHAWINYRAQAKARGLSFKLTRKRFDALVLDSCFYCGLPPNPINGIDRVDNTRGYSINNVVTACKQCNWAKVDLTQRDFISWVKRVAERLAQA
jgi:hypothetical protein